MKEHLDKVKNATSQTLSRHVLKALDDARQQIEAQAMRFVGAKLPPIKEEAPGVAERFTRNLWNYFDALASLSPTQTEIEPDNYDNLTLVDHDYLEAMIAMEGMVKQMRDREFKGVKSLVTRLETMFPNTRIDESNNPLDPEQIGDCFNEAIRPLGLKAHYLLSIYREFNKSVFGNYDAVIDEANDVLVELGVLPELDITAEERERRKASRAKARAQLETEQKAREEAEQRALAARSAAPESPQDNSEGDKAAARAAARAQLEAELKATLEAQQASGYSPGTSGQAAPGELARGNEDLFAMMQTLVQSLSNKQTDFALPASSSIETADLAASQDLLREQQKKLKDMLSDIQSSMLTNGAQTDASSIGKSINEELKSSQQSGELSGIDHQSSDVINLVTLLYQAIWNDPALPVAMKELIGRTQISIMKVALSDTDFFANEQHPGRRLLNEMALTGVAWTESDDLATDAVYNALKEMIESFLVEPEVSNEFLEELVTRVRELRGSRSGSDLNLERRVQQDAGSGDNMDDIHAYVTQTINERILKGYLDPAIRQALDTHIHNFLVKLVLKEGPNGKSWKPVLSTIDVLLWTVQADKHPGDRERFNRINPRLLDNLTKALQIGGASKTKITKFMRQLKQIQEYTFHKAEFDTGSPAKDSEQQLLEINTNKESAGLTREDPLLRKVDKLPIGTWCEFQSSNGKALRCSVVAKIDSIDKLFFANQEGRKVAELTRMQFAAALKNGSARIVSEGDLVDRAMKSVIDDLKNNFQKDASDPKDSVLA